MSKATLRDRWEQLNKLQEVTRAHRGFALEKLLYDLARHEGLECQPSFRPEGEQVDGLVEVLGRFLLLEAKWTAEKIPASEIYAFRQRSKVSWKARSLCSLQSTISRMLCPTF